MFRRNVSQNGSELCHASVGALTRSCYGYNRMRYFPRLWTHSKSVPLRLTRRDGHEKPLLFFVPQCLVVLATVSCIKSNIFSSVSAFLSTEIGGVGWGEAAGLGRVGERGLTAPLFDLAQKVTQFSLRIPRFP